MTQLEKFLSLSSTKELQKEGKEEELGRMAISMGTIGKDNELRSYGFSLLANLAKQGKLPD